MAQNKHRLALVLSGGGARGAYESGVINYIRSELPKTQKTRSFDIVCGTSVGAINTSFMAATMHDPEHQGILSRKLWEELTEDTIYRRDASYLLKFLSRSSWGIFKNFIKGPERKDGHFNGFLDTSPLKPHLEKVIPWQNISPNVKNGILKAISIVATNVFTGKPELFIEKHDSIEYTGDYTIHLTQIKAEHAMASAAIPVIFPSILVDGIAYIDGGLRLNTPMSPAIQLGADSILIIGMHHAVKPGTKLVSHGQAGKHPPLGQVLGRVVNSLFLDKIQYDLEQLNRINTVIEWGETVYGKNFIGEINEMILKKNIRGDIANRGLKKLKVMSIQPSEDVGEMFSDCYKKYGAKHFKAFEKMLVRLLDIDPTGGVDFLSYIAFMPDYIKRLLDLGYKDAKSKHNELIEFMSH